MDKQGILSWPNPSPETVLFFSGRVEPPHSSQDDLRDDLSVNSYCRVEMDEDREEVSAVSSCPCVSDSLWWFHLFFSLCCRSGRSRLFCVHHQRCLLSRGRGLSLARAPMIMCAPLTRSDVDVPASPRPLGQNTTLVPTLASAVTQREGRTTRSQSKTSVSLDLTSSPVCSNFLLWFCVSPGLCCGLSRC